MEHEFIYKGSVDLGDADIKKKLAALNANLTLADIVFQETPGYYVTRGWVDSLEAPVFERLMATSLSGYHRPHGILDDVQNVDLVVVNGHLAGFHLGYVQNVVYQCQEIAGIPCHLLQVLLLAGAQAILGILHQQLSEPND